MQLRKPLRQKKSVKEKASRDCASFTELKGIHTFTRLKEGGTLTTSKDHYFFHLKG